MNKLVQITLWVILLSASKLLSMDDQTALSDWQANLSDIPDSKEELKKTLLQSMLYNLEIGRENSTLKKERKLHKKGLWRYKKLTFCFSMSFATIALIDLYFLQKVARQKIPAWWQKIKQWRKKENNAQSLSTNTHGSLPKAAQSGSDTTS